MSFLSSLAMDTIVPPSRIKMASTDYYKVLGLERNASDDAIRSAYKELARKYHPDVNPDDPHAEERFKEIAEAYAVLGNAKKRSEYDTRGPEGFHPGVDVSEIFRRARAGGANPIDLGSLFGDLFGGMGGGGMGGGWGAPARRGGDIEATLQIDFRDAVEGVTMPLQIQGAGRAESITVRIPPGVSEGGRLRIAGKGQPGHGGPPGDLYVRIQVRPHPFFKREGDAVVCRLPVTIVEATLGGQVTVPTLDGETTMTVPAGTQSGQRFRIKGKGIPQRHGGRGPLYVDVRIVPPTRVDEESRKLLQEFAQRNPQDDLRAGLPGGKS
jgi:DnaJ-class molecular chaperone